MDFPLLAHIHIFKTGGTSLQQALERNFPDNAGFRRIRVQEAKNGFLAKKDIEVILAESPGISAISSHTLSANLPSHIGNRKIIPLVLLREPLRRAESMFRHYCTLADPHYPEEGLAASVLGFEEWLQARFCTDLKRDICNGQTRFLTPGEGLAERNLTDTDGMAAVEYARALNYLGTLERLMESLAVWEYQLRAIFPSLDLSIGWVNVTRDLSPTSRAEPPKGAYARRLREANSFDLEIHRIANKKLDESIRAVPHWSSILEDFIRRCAQRGRESPRLPKSCGRSFRFPLTRHTGDAQCTSPYFQGLSFELFDGNRALKTVFDRGEALRIHFNIQRWVGIRVPLIYLTVSTTDDRVAFIFTVLDSERSDQDRDALKRGEFDVELQLPQVNNGFYCFNLHVYDGTVANRVLVTDIKKIAWIAIGPEIPRVRPGILYFDSYSPGSVRLSASAPMPPPVLPAAAHSGL